MLTLTNRIDMRPGAVPLVIHLGQYDSDFSLVFELYSSAGNFTVESGTTAMIRGTKTDGHAYDADATIDVSAKTVTVAGSEQMTAAKGRNVYELVLTKSGKVLSTANFILDVERAAMDADTIASESVLKELNAIIAGAETATEAATNAASAADRAEDAAESVSSASAQIATNTADIADLKADLTDIQEEIESIEPLSDNAVVALLACFQHVAWTTPESQSYYDALEEALYEGRRQLERIEATYTSTGHTVYPWDTLESLRPYMIVTATYNDGSTKTIFDYMLSGDLTSAASTVTISYGDKSAQVSVSVNSTSGLQYHMQNGTTVDSSVVDTGVKLIDTNKAVSIVADITDEEILSRVRTMFFMTDRDSTTGVARWQLSCTGSASDEDFLKKYTAIGAGAAGMHAEGKANTAHRIKFAMLHDANTTTYTLYLNVDDVVAYNFQSIPGYWAAGDATLHIGGRPDGGYFWKGTVNLFGVYFRAMPESEAKQILGVA